MMSDTPERSPFATAQVSAEDWVIHDQRYAESDARRVVAAVHQGEDDLLEVVWLTYTPLPTSYMFIDDVIDDLVRWWREENRVARKPNPIPHLPPVMTIIGPEATH